MRIETFTGGPFVENGYVAVCSASGASVVIDPGGGAADMVAFLSSEGLGLDAILLTHAHLDHVDGLRTVLEHASAPIYLHPDDRELYDAAPAQGEAFERKGQQLGTSIVGPLERLRRPAVRLGVLALAQQQVAKPKALDRIEQRVFGLPFSLHGLGLAEGIPGLSGPPGLVQGIRSLGSLLRSLAG